MNTRTMTFEAFAADRLIEQRMELTDLWATRIAEEKPGAHSSMTGLHYVAHMPDVLQWVSLFVQDDRFPLAEQPAVSDAVATLARLRRTEGADAQVLMHEYDLLAQVLDGACLQWLAEFGNAEPDAVVRVAGRLNRAPIALAGISVNVYWSEERAEATRSTERVRDFADAITHELKTPLNAASMTAQLLEYTTGARSGEAKRLASIIRRNLDRADAVLRNVRSAALRLAEQSEPRALPFGQVLGAVLAELREELQTARVQLEVDEPIPGHGVDAAPLRIILRNLIRNAIRYRHAERGAEVHIGFRRCASDGLWWVEVHDNGIGIALEHHAHVFHRAFRERPDSGDGAGMGLTIVRREIEQLGAHIEFSSEPGIGSTFRFSLPEVTLNESHDPAPDGR